MDYGFDSIHSRKNTQSAKYHLKGRPDDTIPLWVADMDFQVPPEVSDALQKRAKHGIFGYSYPGRAYFDAVAGWYKERFDWTVKPSWLFTAPGVVFTLSIAVRALTQVGDAILIQQPVYYPFQSVIENNGRRLVNNQLIYEEGEYTIDFEEFERQIKQSNVRMFILCSPHNPVGRVWTRDELTTMGDICMRHGVIVVSDEIHADFVYPGHQHHVFAGLSPQYAQHTVTCTAPSKTFNLAGLQVSNAFVQNKDYLSRMEQEKARCGYGSLNSMAIVACEAAYRHGGPWLDALLIYLRENITYTEMFLAKHAPDIRPTRMEGTYLMWLNFLWMGLSDKELERRLKEDARVWLNSGHTFGSGGEGFFRMNLACPRSVLKEALQRMADVFSCNQK